MYGNFSGAVKKCSFTNSENYAGIVSYPVIDVLDAMSRK